MSETAKAMLTITIDRYKRISNPMIARTMVVRDLEDILEYLIDLKPVVESEAEIIEALGEEEGREAIDYIARQKEMDRKFLAERFSNKAVLSFEGMEDFE